MPTRLRVVPQKRPHRTKTAAPHRAGTGPILQRALGSLLRDARIARIARMWVRALQQENFFTARAIKLLINVERQAGAKGLGDIFCGRRVRVRSAAVIVLRGLR